MSDEDLKAVLATYQQKCFELFNSNIVLETQVKSLQGKVATLSVEVEKLKKKRTTKTEGDFE
jgi:hypothetical protein